MTPRPDAETVVEIERCAMRAVPAAETDEIDGWLLTAGAGVVQRTNSVTTFGARPTDLTAAVADAERWYAERGLPPRFRLTDLDRELDGLLDDRAFDRSVDVSVMTVGLGAVQRADLDPPEVGVEVRASRDWLDALGRLAGQGQDRTAELAAGLAVLDLPHGAFRIGGLPSPAAVGLAVVDGDWVGLFDIAVDPSRRRAGHGRRITASMMQWASTTHGAAHAYLQVVTTNEPAIELYRSLGFEESYRYWYRTGSISPVAAP